MNNLEYANSTLEKQYGRGWYYTRVLFSIVAIITIIPRFQDAHDLFGNSTMRFINGLFSFAKFHEITESEAIICNILAIMGLFGVIKGKYFFHIGLLTWLIFNGIYLTSEALNIKGFDRLLFFMGLVLLVSPAAKANQVNFTCSNLPRRLMLVLFSSLYLSTGIFKLAYEPGWFNGEALQYGLNHQWHGGSQIAVFLSTMKPLMLVLGIFTIIFEIAAGILIWLPMTNPPILLLGVFFHLGIASTMQVGVFSYAALAAYPILLNPESLEGLIRKIKRNS